MHNTRFLFSLYLAAFLLYCENSLTAQCATGKVVISSVSADGGAGTYSDPVTGNILINYCITLDKFNEINTNWVHGIFIAWDNLPEGAVINVGPNGSQPTQHGNRFWVYFDSAQAKTQNLPGPGYYVDDGDDIPSNNYGDNGLGTPNAKFPDLEPFCFVIAFNCSFSSPIAYVPKITITGDGTTGGWSNGACPGDLIRALDDGPNGNGSVVICGIVLPVKLFEFKGHASEQGNLVEWTAFTDNLFGHFELEISESNHGVFQQLSKIEAIRGTPGNEIHAYRYLDANPLLSSLYRLKMIEKDGSFVCSKIISINQSKRNDQSNRFTSSPNPATDFIIIHNETDSNFGEIEINLYDLTGKKISSSKFLSDKSERDYLIELSNVGSGMYFLDITSGNQSIEKFNVIKQ